MSENPMIQVVILVVNGKDYAFVGAPFAEEDMITGEDGRLGVSVDEIRIVEPFVYSEPGGTE